MSDRSAIVAIMGPSASGKDSLAWSLTSFLQRQRRMGQISDRTHMIVSDTTRPMRRGEHNGLDYNFLDWFEFMRRYDHDEYIETYVYGPQRWMYGTPKDQLVADINIGVFSPSGLDGLERHCAHTHEIVPVLLDAPRLTRLWRSIKRDRMPKYEHLRRMHQDSIDFKRLDRLMRRDTSIDLRSQKISLDSLTEMVYNMLCEMKVVHPT